MERSIRPIVLGIDISSFGEQKLYGLGAVADRQAVKRNDFVAILSIDIRTLVHEKLHNLEMDTTAGPVKRRTAIFISGIDQLRILFDQGFHTFQISLLGEFVNLFRERQASERYQNSYQNQYTGYFGFFRFVCQFHLRRNMHFSLILYFESKKYANFISWCIRDGQNTLCPFSDNSCPYPNRN